MDLLAASHSHRRVCLFAEYRREGRFSASTVHYLSELLSAGFVVHVAVSGDGTLDPADRATLDGIGVHAHPRRNGGLDFGAWQDLLHAGAADGADEILLANDSVFGPFAPLSPIIRSMAGFDAWGMVESREGLPHLQSWFVWMSGDAFRRPAVQRVFSQPFAAMRKAEIIVRGELALSAALQAEELDWGARYRAPFRIRPSRLVATNPMHFHWRRVLLSGAVPFLKVELLRDNPSRILGVDAWRTVLREAGVADGSPLLAAIALARGEGRRDRIDGRQAVLQLALREDRMAVLRDVFAMAVRRNGRV